MVYIGYNVDSVMCLIFFFNDTATTEIYTLSLHDALPIWVLVARRWTAACSAGFRLVAIMATAPGVEVGREAAAAPSGARSEEHTSELQSRQYLVCRLLLEKKNNNPTYLLYHILLDITHSQ